MSTHFVSPYDADEIWCSPYRSIEVVLYRQRKVLHTAINYLRDPGHRGPENIPTPGCLIAVIVYGLDRVSSHGHAFSHLNYRGNLLPLDSISNLDDRKRFTLNISNRQTDPSELLLRVFQGITAPRFPDSLNRLLHPEPIIFRQQQKFRSVLVLTK
jgi:hypothetical protein